MPARICLRFGLATPNLRTAVLCLTSNASENCLSDFIALGFLKVTDGPGYIGLLSVNYEGVYTISSLRMDLYCC